MLPLASKLQRSSFTSKIRPYKPKIAREGSKGAPIRCPTSSLKSGFQRQSSRCASTLSYAKPFCLTFSLRINPPKRLTDPKFYLFRFLISRNELYRPQSKHSWVLAALIASAGAATYFLDDSRSAHAEEMRGSAKQVLSREEAEILKEKEYREQLAAIQTMLESLMRSGIAYTTLPDLASQLWDKVAARDASGLAIVLGSSSQLSGAMSTLLRMLEEGRDRRELCKPLAVAYILRGQFEQALPFLAEASWEYPTDPELHLHQGHIFMRENDFSRAFEHFEKALLLNPSLTTMAEAPRNEMFKRLGLSKNSELYWHVQGVIRFDLGMYAESYECYQRALAINPQYEDSWYNSKVVKHILDQQNLYKEEYIDAIPAKDLPIVTSYEYATLAESAYMLSAKAVPPKDWQLWLTSGDFMDKDGSLSKDGFFGAVYVNHRKQQVVLALQGSKSTNDIISCIHLVFNTVDRQWVCAKLFGEKVHEKIAKDPVLSKYRVSFTGHSLGAAQAEYLSIIHNEPAVTFESPGIYQLLPILIPSVFSTSSGVTGYHNSLANLPDPSNFAVTSYMPRPNIINTAKRHIGQLIRIYPPLPPKQIKAEGSNVIQGKLDAIKKITDILWVPTLDRVVSSPLGKELLKVLGETELMVLETAHWHSMSRICQVFRHEYETGIPVKQRTIVRWPQTENFYLFWRVARDSFGEPDEFNELSELNREGLKFANYEVHDRHMNRVSWTDFSRSEQRFLREYRRNPSAFDSRCSELDKRVLAKYALHYAYIDINVGLSPEHFRDFVKWKAAQVADEVGHSALSFSPLF